jgi:GNAT superfamily N-acetyltransferase
MFDEIRTRFFPAELVPGIDARAVDKLTFDRDVWSIFNQVFAPIESAYQTREAAQDALANVSYPIHRERIVFYDDQGAGVGWSWGVMRDTETFFMTNTGILSAYRRRGIYTAFLKQFVSYLSALGYERIISAHQVNNRPVIIAKLKVGFVITGMDLDERWGPQVVLAYFPHEDRGRGYERAFSMGQWS